MSYANNCSVQPSLQRSFHLDNIFIVSPKTKYKSPLVCRHSPELKKKNAYSVASWENIHGVVCARRRRDAHFLRPSGSYVPTFFL
jgi:hypothetical protein